MKLNSSQIKKNTSIYLTNSKVYYKIRKEKSYVDQKLATINELPSCNQKASFNRHQF